MRDGRNMPLSCILPKVHTTLKFITIKFNVSSTCIHACVQMFMWMYMCVCVCVEFVWAFTMTGEFAGFKAHLHNNVRNAIKKYQKSDLCFRCTHCQ